MDEDSIYEGEMEYEDAECVLLSTPATKRSRRSKPKVSELWTETDIFQLIASVEAHPCVWNAGDKHYSDKTARRNAWVSIADQFENEYSVNEVNAKWSNLRIQYRSYAVRAKKKSGKGAESLPKWKYFNSMSFLENAQKSDYISNVSLDDSNDSTNTVAVATNKSRILTPTKRRRRRTAPAPSPDASSFREAVAAIKDQKEDDRRTAPASSPAPSSSAIAIETLREAVAAIREQKEDDRDVVFSKFILSELRALSESEAHVLRTRLHRTLLEFAEERQSS